ncbi:MFS transporter [Streptomyces sp. SCA3-4]|uniref:MFS transporter n=1 Tax=Streptomyces sichuanensis TaxID=2871810 RepID=UPI001CE2FB53|nr:MFS transporter [Streptomyces sichuanensis]MCA6095540.1 MFS transporter [Streptomyces sichuanensis]
MALLALAPRFVTETPRKRGRFDLIGALSATGAAVAIVWALTGAPEHGWTSAQTIGSLTAGGALLAALAGTERRVTNPMLVPSLLRDRRRLGALAVTTLVFGSQIATFFLVVQYVQRVLHFGPIAAGAAFVPMTLGIFAMARTAPTLVARFGQTPLLITGTLGLTASHVRLSNIDTTSGYVSAVLGHLLINGISAGLTFMPAASLVMGGVQQRHAGSASGLLQTVQQLGGAIGLAVVVSVYAAGAVPGRFVPRSPRRIPDHRSIHTAGRRPGSPHRALPPTGPRQNHLKHHPASRFPTVVGSRLAAVRPPTGQAARSNEPFTDQCGGGRVNDPEPQDSRQSRSLEATTRNERENGRPTPRQRSYRTPGPSTP